MTVCMKCREPNEMIDVGDTDSTVLLRCLGCHGMGTYRAQAARGTVVRAGIETCVVEAAGELTAPSAPDG